MAEFRLSERSKAKLVEIDAYTEQFFGRYQANAYSAGFERTFGLLADFPRIGIEVPDLANRHRRFRFQSHNIFYTEEPYGVLIRDIFHASQNVRPALFR
jgi:toxin ParE1/3/4